MPRRVVVGRGPAESALVDRPNSSEDVLWKVYSQKAQDTGSQGLTVSLNGAAGAARVDLSTSRSRFDLIEGAEVTIGRWHA